MTNYVTKENCTECRKETPHMFTSCIYCNHKQSIEDAKTYDEEEKKEILRQMKEAEVDAINIQVMNEVETLFGKSEVTAVKTSLNKVKRALGDKSEDNQEDNSSI